jgi:peptidoglycan hydrolase FlgJ
MDPIADLPLPRAAVAAPATAAAVEQFEALLIGELAGLMLGTVGTEGPFGGGHAETIYRDLMAEHLGSAVARRGGLGLAPALMDEVIRMQAGA